MGRENMMLVPVFAGDDDEFEGDDGEFEGGDAYLGDDDFEGEDDFEGDDAEALEIGRQVMNARGFRRGGKRLRRCRQHLMRRRRRMQQRHRRRLMPPLPPAWAPASCLLRPGPWSARGGECADLSKKWALAASLLGPGAGPGKGPAAWPP